MEGVRDPLFLVTGLERKLDDHRRKFSTGGVICCIVAYVLLIYLVSICSVDRFKKLQEILNFESYLFLDVRKNLFPEDPEGENQLL